jgi:GNAT superfamily N-acetyltransferase
MQHITISTDKSKLQVSYIHAFLAHESYWSKNIPIELVIRSIDGSICFGVYDGNRQIGFARVITDHATFAYLADVFIDKAYRGKRISKQLMSYIMDYEPLKGIRSFMLATLDAHSLYEQFGFQPLKEPARYMSIKFFESY